MNNTRSGVDFMSAPKDLDDLFRIYYPYVVALVRKYGIAESQKEDVASEILLRFMERGYLEKFDPTLVFEYDGKKRPARFKTFLSYIVVSYVRGQRDALHRIADREFLIIDRAPKDATDGWWITDELDNVPGHEDDVLEMLHGQQLVNDIRTYLQTVPKRCQYDQCDLVDLFDAVLDQIKTNEQVVARELREKFGLSATGMNGWMWWLRANIAEFLGIPLPPKRTRRTA